MSKHQLLLIGPRYSPEAIGGIVVLFEDLIFYCNKEKINYKVIDTNKSNYQTVFIAYIIIIFSIIKLSRNSNHISLHGTAKDYLFIAPIAVLISKLYSKKISLRKFAGSFFEIYENSNIIFRLFYRYALKKADFLFFETKFLVDKISFLNTNIFWWPNSRFKNLEYKSNETFSKKFVFISQVKMSKGVFEFMEASNYFDSSYTFDIYGPIMNDEFEIKMTGYKNINYKGVLKPKEVSKKLQEYDVLVLPTYHEGEGYPGIIIEAFSLGLPVISTNWNSIPEIVQNNYNGIIIQIKCKVALKAAIASFNVHNYTAFSQNAYESFGNFNSNLVYSHFIKIIYDSK